MTRINDLFEGISSRVVGLREIIFFAVVLGTLVSVLGTTGQSYQYSTSDHLEMLPMIYRSQDSGYLQNDFFVNSTDGFNHRSYYIWLMRHLGAVVSLPGAHFLLNWLLNVLMVFFTFRVGRDLFNGSVLGAVLACAMVMSLDVFHLGHDLSLRFSSLTPHRLALPFALMGFWAGVRQRPLLCGLICGVVSSIHPTVALQSGTLGLAASGMVNLFGLDKTKTDAVRKLKYLSKVILGVVIMGGFAVLFWHRYQSDPIDTATFIDIYGRFRHSHHFFPSTFGTRYIPALCFLACTIVSWKWWLDRPSTNRSTAWAILFTIVFLLIGCVCAYVFVELIPTRLWLSTMWFRMLLIVKWLGLMLIAGTVAGIFDQGINIKETLSGWLVLIGSGQFSSLSMLWGYIVELFQRRFGKVVSSGVIRIFLGGSVLIAIILKAAGFIHDSNVGWGIKEAFFVPLFLFISIWFAAAENRRLCKIVLVSIVLVAVGIVAVDRFYTIGVLSRLAGPFQPVLVTSDQKGPIADVADFARENTEGDAIFLTPPRFGGFRLIAERALIVDWKCVPFPDKDMLEWKRRLSDCYGESSNTSGAAAGDLEKLYMRITDEKIDVLAKKYKASYAVIYRETGTAFPIVFENEKYKLIKLR